MDNSKLIAKIQAYCRKHGLTDTSFGWAALKDPNLVSDLRAGRELRRKTLEKLQNFMGIRKAA
jgi:hypothetical protein